MIADEAGELDIEEARRVAKALKEKFPQLVEKVTGEGLDEWFILTVHLCA